MFYDHFSFLSQIRKTVRALKAKVLKNDVAIFSTLLQKKYMHIFPLSQKCVTHIIVHRKTKHDLVWMRRNWNCTWWGKSTFECLFFLFDHGALLWRKCLFAQIFENIHQGWNLKLAARLKLCSTEPLPMYRNRKGLANGPSCLLNDELCDVILLFCRIDFYSGFKLLFMPKGNCRAYHSDAIHWSNIDRGTTSVSGL